MRTKDEILAAIQYIESAYTAETIPDFVRGQYTMLVWILDEKENNTEKVGP